MDKKTNKLFCTVSVALFIFFSHCVCATTQATLSRLEMFERAIAASITTNKNSSIHISEQRAKDGRHSLRWDYNNSRGQTAHLTIAQHIDFKPFQKNNKDQRRSTFMCWIYNDTVINDSLAFQFSRDNQPAAFFTVALNFQGWRAFVIPFESAMQGNAVPGMDRLTITAPPSIKKGTLFFDQLGLSVPVDPRHPAQDIHAPFVNPGIENRPNAHWTALRQFDQWQQAFSLRPKRAANHNELAAMAAIERIIDQDLLAKVPAPDTADFEQIHAQYQSWLITTAQQTHKHTPELSEPLKPLMMWRSLSVYNNINLAETDLQFLKHTTLRFETLGDWLLQLARHYRKTQRSDIKQQLAALFLHAIDHAHEQGLAHGSGLGIMHHQGYYMRSWAQAVFLMREVLRDKRPLVQQQLAWYMGLGRILRPADQINGFNMDIMRTMLNAMLYSILLLDDNRQKVAYLHQFSRWMSLSTTTIQGLAGGFHADGSMFHHAQHYVRYGNGALKHMTPVVYYLSNTPFRLSQDAHQRIHHSVLMQRVFSNDLKIPMMLGGRWVDGQQVISIQPFKYMALAGSPDNQQAIDHTMAAAYLRLQKNPDDPFFKQLTKAGFHAENAPNGSWVMNMSCLILHRRDDWLASARGFSRYLVSHESYVDANHFGRYINYGHLSLLPADSSKRAFSEPGWDWNRWPGTTVINKPLPQLAARITQVDTDSGQEEMLLSDQRFCGANALGHHSAMFAMQLHEHPKYEGSFRANKSYFFFDDLIIALGSDIENTQAQYNTQTTLFQHKLPDPSQPGNINGNRVSGLNIEKTIAVNDAMYLIDPQYNVYYIPENQQLNIFRKKQQSLDNAHKKPNEGAFFSAVIDHGNAPTNGQYEYAILVAGAKKSRLNREKNALQQIKIPTKAALSSYKVLQKNNQAHIVHHHASSTTAYALFKANETINDKLIKSVDTPIMLIAQPDTGQLTLSVVNPDLNLYQGTDTEQYDSHGQQKEVSIYSRHWRHKAALPTAAKITLRGNWTKPDNNKNYNVIKKTNNSTTIKVNLHLAQPVKLQLQKINTQAPQ